MPVEASSAGFFLPGCRVAAIYRYMPAEATSMRRTNAPQVALLATCVANALRPSVAEAALRLLRHAGCAVTVPEQACCGQPAFNAGFEEEARRTGAALVTAFSGHDAVVAPSASCAGMVRNHLPELFLPGSAGRREAEALAARTHELCDFLHRVGAAPLAKEWRGGPVVWHDSCASLRETPMTEAALALLRQVPGLEVRLPDEEARQGCCGFGGLFSVKQPELSTELGRRKLAALVAAANGEPVVVTGPDMGCLSHLQAVAEAAGLPVRVMHVVEILAGDAP